MALSHELTREPRLVMRLARRGVHGVPVLGHYNYKCARPGLRNHSHQGAMEICFLVRGCQTYRVGNSLYHLKGGDVFVTFPNERHSTGGSPEEKGVLYWLVLQFSTGQHRFIELPRKPAQAMRQALLGLKSRHFRGSWKMKEHLDAVTRLYHQPATSLRSVAMVNQIVAFLLEIIACDRASSSRILARPLASVFEYIDEHLGEPISIGQLAAQAGLSVARFKVRFKRETGMPPGEYVLRKRIKKASGRLTQNNATITEIAYDLGFSSSQYFATVFKRFTGHNPSSLRMRAKIQRRLLGGVRRLK